MALITCKILSMKYYCVPSLLLAFFTADVLVGPLPEDDCRCLCKIQLQIICICPDCKGKTECATKIAVIVQHIAAH